MPEQVAERTTETWPHYVGGSSNGQSVAHCAGSSSGWSGQPKLETLYTVYHLLYNNMYY